MAFDFLTFSSLAHTIPAAQLGWIGRNMLSENMRGERTDFRGVFTIMGAVTEAMYDPGQTGLSEGLANIFVYRLSTVFTMFTLAFIKLISYQLV